MKKILLLGAMQMHIPLIKYAKEQGLYVITCDYVTSNEGHKYANEAHYDSTTDINAVLALAKASNIDAILTFNSDPAALTAAYVAEKLNLPNSGFEAVKIMSIKDLQRDFLSKHNFNVPRFGSYTNVQNLKKDLELYTFPILLKPVDSSGSKGINLLKGIEHLEEYFQIALSFSRCKRVIAEEYIEPSGAQLHGDAFVYNNKIQFIYLGDHHFDPSINNLVPYSTTFPSQHSPEEIKKVIEEVERFISLVNFKQGGINIEARISAKDQKVYLIEIGPRNGGNFTPIVIQHASGFNFINAALNASLGKYNHTYQAQFNGYFAYLILHSHQDGQLKSIHIKQELSNKIIEKYIYLSKGEQVHSFYGANTAIGVLITRFDSLEEMNQIVNNFSNLYNIELL